MACSSGSQECGHDANTAHANMHTSHNDSHSECSHGDAHTHGLASVDGHGHGHSHSHGHDGHSHGHSHDGHSHGHSHDGQSHGHTHSMRRHIPMIKVTIVDGVGKELLSLQLHISDAIKWVRQEVAAAVGLPVAQIGLIHQSRLLVDGCNVSRAGIKDGDTLHVVAVQP